MVKKILLGMFLAVVAMATTTEAAVMNFRGVINSGTHAGAFTLDFDVVDTVGGFTNGSTTVTPPGLSGVRLVTSQGVQAFSGAGSFTTFTLGGAFDSFNVELYFNGGSNFIAFNYITPTSSWTGSRDITRQNVYDFMFEAGVPVPNIPWVSRADNFSHGFGGDGTGSIESVPEPGSMAALAFLTSGIAGFAYRRRKAKAKK
jgi:hypothetical protein